MYYQGETKNIMSIRADEDNTAVSGSPESSSTRPSQVRVVSFDLDNTLWRTGPTIQAANDALATYLTQEGIVQPERVEKIMGQLFQQHDKFKYAPLWDDDDDPPKSPVLLTQLRKDALRHVLEEYNDYSSDDAVRKADEAFHVWTTARHEALPHHFATCVISCLQKIRQVQAISNCGTHRRPVLIGAITDGNSDPRSVPILSGFFDFVVNAEGVGIAKPDKRLYMAAIKEVSSHPFVEDIFENVDTENDDLLEDIIGPWWIHVGDDFLKDIVAAKDMGMRNIWAQELVQDKPEPTPVKKSEKSVEQFVKEISDKLADKSYVEMAVGSDDYLVDSMQSEFADAIVYSFEQVGETIVAWQKKAVSTQEVTSSLEEPATIDSPLKNSRRDIIHEEKRKAGGKFCTSCGTKLPLSAMYCSACGEKQSEIS